MENYFGFLRFGFLLLLSFFLFMVLKVMNRSMDEDIIGEEEAPQPLILEVIQGGEYLRNPAVGKFEIDNKAVIGRNEECGIPVEDPFASGEHSVIFRKKSKFHIKDCNSKNGTTVNGKIISSETRLKRGDEISLGNILFRVDL